MLLPATLAAAAMMAAAASPDVMGQILDETGQPMPFVNVVLLNAQDSTFIQGATSDLDGHFMIATPQNHGLLRISSVGYLTLYIGVDADGRLKEGTEGNVISMIQDRQLLDEVVVKGQLPKTRLTGNSMVTSIQGSMLESSGSALEMLAKVPGMMQGKDEVEVIGKGAPVIYLNGRKLQDKDELKRLRSEDIQEVEVIQNPGALYDATVSAVVRIKTIRHQGDGFGYTLVADHNQDLRYGYSDPSATLDLRYRHAGIDLFGKVNYWKWDTVNDSDPLQHSYLKGETREIVQKMLLRHDWNGQGMNYNLGFNWQLTDNHSLGLRVERHDRFNTGVKANISTELTRIPSNGNPEPAFHSYVEQDNHQTQPYSWEGNAYYSGKVGKLGIDLNVDFLTSKNRETNDIKQRSDDNQECVLMNQRQNTAARMWASKLVLSYPLWNGQLQAGTELTFVDRTTYYEINGYPLPTNDSEVSEDNVAAFVEYAASMPQIGNFTLGFRYEHVGFDYSDFLSPDKSMSRFTDDFFPSLSWSRQWGRWQVSSAYSFKTIRPSYQMLDEGIIYLNNYSLQQGDSKLRNATMQELSANLRWSWVNFFAAYERRDHSHTQWSYLYNDEGVVLVKNINLSDPVRNLALFLSATPTWGCWSPSWTAGWQQFYYTQQLLDPREPSGTREVSYDKPMRFFDINNTFRFRHNWQLEANMNILLHGDAMNWHLTSDQYRLRFVVQKSWLPGNALCLRASIDDVLRHNDQEILLDCGYYTLLRNNHNNNHRLSLSLRYTFNASQSKYKGTGAGRDAIERL